MSGSSRFSKLVCTRPTLFEPNALNLEMRNCNSLQLSKAEIIHDERFFLDCKIFLNLKFGPWRVHSMNFVASESAGRDAFFQEKINKNIFEGNGEREREREFKVVKIPSV